MKPDPAPSKIYKAPGYVMVFSLLGLLGVILGLIVIFVSVSQEESPWLGACLLVGGFFNFLYGQIADAVARTNWRTELLAHELAPVIAHVRTQAAVREKEDAARQRAQDEEISRVLSARPGTV